MLTTFCEVGRGFSILKKDDFRADSMIFPAFMRSRAHMKQEIGSKCVFVFSRLKLLIQNIL